MFNHTNDEALYLRVLFLEWQRSPEMARLKLHFSQAPSPMNKTEMNLG